MNIGKIISVEYDKFRVKLFHTTKTSALSLNGQIYYFGNIGSFLKTYNVIGDSIICEVVAILDHNIESKIYSSYNLDSARELVIKPIGTLDKNRNFNMGIGIFPTIYSDVSIVTFEDIETILSTVHKDGKHIDNQIHKEIEIGRSKNLINYKISLNINKLFNIHTAVLGNSGSGKSNTIAHILQEVYRKQDNHAVGAKTILFDVNGEYPRAFEKKHLNEQIQIKFYKPNTTTKSDIFYADFFLPYYLLNLDEWLAFLMASERTQKPFWDRVLQESFKFYRIFQSTEKQGVYVNYFKWKTRNILNIIVSKADSDTAKITAAQGVILRFKNIIAEIQSNSVLNTFLDEINNKCDISYGNNDGHLSGCLVDMKIDEEQAIAINEERLRTGEYFDYKFFKTAVDMVLLEEEAKGNTRIREFVSTMLSRLDYFLNNSDCDFMRNCTITYSNSEDYLKKCFGITDNDFTDQLIVVDSSEVGSDVLELMTSVISRMIFDYRKKKQGDNRRKEPVHLILDEAHRYIKKDAEYILKENIFERIAREGRKFSLYLLISSQRPSELSSTVLSQCGNYIVHRIQNEIDMKYIYSVLPYFSDDYTTKIKQAVPGEALIFGNCVPMPLQVKVTRANPDPNSENCDISKEWFQKKILKDNIAPF
ncbi:MAG: ATP-binding protein [Bacteroidales bacterium]|jgi:DNA helicase HerA-like ATPase|nr:ATP-binding protein [Bacteroidales bacterium]